MVQMLNVQFGHYLSAAEMQKKNQKRPKEPPRYEKAPVKKVVPAPRKLSFDVSRIQNTKSAGKNVQWVRYCCDSKENWDYPDINDTEKRGPVYYLLQQLPVGKCMIIGKPIHPTDKLKNTFGDTIRDDANVVSAVQVTGHHLNNISRVQMLIYREKEGYFICDKSKNGTFISDPRGTSFPHRATPFQIPKNALFAVQPNTWVTDCKRMLGFYIP